MLDGGPTDPLYLVGRIAQAINDKEKADTKEFEEIRSALKWTLRIALLALAVGALNLFLPDGVVLDLLKQWLGTFLSG